MTKRTVLAMAIVGLCLSAGATLEPGATLFESFDAKALPPTVTVEDGVAAKSVRHGGGRALRVTFPADESRGLRFTAPDGGWDWSAYEGLALDVENTERRSVDLFLRVNSRDESGRLLVGRISRTLEPRERATVHLFFTNGGTGPFQGLRAIPVYGVMSLLDPRTRGFDIDPARVESVQVYLRLPDSKSRLIVDNARLFEPGSPAGQVVPFPFIDRFGQYIHRDWPGKVRDASELKERRLAEEALYAASPELPGRDQYGGWADGPKLDATGWFRTAEIDGKWWLVTPNGHLFFSLGMNCVRVGGATKTTGRESWFEWLPGPDDGPLAGAGFDGRASFYRANVIRKYGADWMKEWRDDAYARLRSSGFNTIGNWSDSEVIANSPMPFTATMTIHRLCPRIEGSEGYWCKMPDVYDPEFPAKLDAAVASNAAPHADNPLCIGYFVDNELPWEGIAQGVLASPPNQPARNVIIEQLQGKYNTIDALNKAWDTQAADWDALRSPKVPNPACMADFDVYLDGFARHYFGTVKAALRKHAPNQLYLGCRFMVFVPDAVVRACAAEVDVVSFNKYVRRINTKDWVGANDLGAPVIIGEFHFGANDRNMFHNGVVPSDNQEARAHDYMEYVRSVADCPAFVGCHWFQYYDQPNTGRGDGENFNVGFVDVTDTAYPELDDAARIVNAEVYERRYKGAR